MWQSTILPYKPKDVGLCIDLVPKKQDLGVVQLAPDLPEFLDVLQETPPGHSNGTVGRYLAPSEAYVTALLGQLHQTADVRLNRVIPQDQAAFRKWYSEDRTKLSGKPFKLLGQSDPGGKSGAKRPAHPEWQERWHEWAERKEW